MKELAFLRQRQLPVTLNVRILKLWNPAVSPVITYFCSIMTQLHSFIFFRMCDEGRDLFQKPWPSPTPLSMPHHDGTERATYS